VKVACTVRKGGWGNTVWLCALPLPYHHLTTFAESIAMNVGGPYGERCSPAMKHRGVGAAIVVRARESRVQGEGPQGIDVRLTNSRRSLGEVQVS
jgi:hypothetical protein